MDTLVSIGKIVNFHGIKGEIRAGYTKGKESQLASLKELYIKVNEQTQKLTIESVRFHKNFAIIKFKEINSINDAEMYKNLPLYTSKEVVEKNLEADEYLVSDLQDICVYDTEDNLLGVVCAVGENNAGNLINIKDKNDKIHMIPFVKELVPVVDLKNNKITVNNIEGLIN